MALHDGLAVYALGAGEPVFFMPGPHRFQRVGTRTGDALIGGLVDIGRRVITFDLEEPVRFWTEVAAFLDGRGHPRLASDRPVEREALSAGGRGGMRSPG